MTILSKEDIILLHSALVETTGGSDGIRDEALLDSAVQTPFQTFDNNEIYPTVMQKAARLCFGLVKDHAFVDGNKRIGAHAMLVFLALNGIEIECGQGELSEMILSVASGNTDAEGIEKWLLEHLM